MSITWNRPQTSRQGRQETAARLLSSSARSSFDPNVEIDWEQPLDPSLYGMTPEWCSLYGTDLWESMTPERRVALTAHEAASISAAGIWFEMILMQMLLRDIYWRDFGSEHVRFALTEIGDECRHSAMFARAARAQGLPSYRPGRVLMWLGAFFKSTSTGSLAYGGTLFAEELLDAMQRDFLRDARIQPITRAVSRIHVTEEARHIRFAREEAIRRAAGLTRAQRAYARLMLGAVAFFIVRALVSPDVYRAVGLDPRAARRAARRNRHHTAMLHEGCARTMEFLNSIGLIGGPSTLLLRRAHIW